MEPTTAAASTIAALQEAATSLGGMVSASLRAGGSRGMVAGASRGNMGMDTYCRCLASWRIDRRRMADWIAGVEHQGEPVARFGREVLALIKRRAEPALAQVVRLGYLRGTHAKTGTATPELVARLAALDEQRYTEPVVAGAAAVQLLEDATGGVRGASHLGHRVVPATSAIDFEDDLGFAIKQSLTSVPAGGSVSIPWRSHFNGVFNGEGMHSVMFPNTGDHQNNRTGSYKISVFYRYAGLSPANPSRL
ncbi:MAG: hypothetical protein AAF560_26025 [Acidobacteriota bacterium]